MRVLRLALLGFLTYLVAIIFLFPAAPVVGRIAPQMQPLTLSGVQGRLFSGSIDQVEYDDGLLPLSFRNVSWKLQPLSLLKGKPGASISFDGYGGSGKGVVSRSWNGTLAVDDLSFDAEAEALQDLLPAPVARFGGKLNADITSVRLRDQLLKELTGTLVWRDALVLTSMPGAPARTSLGRMNLLIEKDSPTSHQATVSANGGDIGVSGTVAIAESGDYAANLVLTPSETTPSDLLDNLRRVARPEANGRFRLTQSGNVNQLM